VVERFHPLSPFFDPLPLTIAPKGAVPPTLRTTDLGGDDGCSAWLHRVSEQRNDACGLAVLLRTDVKTFCFRHSATRIESTRFDRPMWVKISLRHCELYSTFSCAIYQAWYQACEASRANCTHFSTILGTNA